MATWCNDDDQNDVVLSPLPKEEAAGSNINDQIDVVLPHQPKEVALGIDNDDQNDVVPLSPMEETPTNQRQQLTSTAETPPPLPSSTNFVHLPPLPSFPIELIAEILWRLPVKTLVKFQSVCRAWKSLISDPQFAKKQFRGPSPKLTQLILNLTNPSCEFHSRLLAYPLPSVFNDDASRVTQLRYPFRNQDRFDLIVGSCHGILCYHMDRNNSLLWNPSTGKYKNLPCLEYQWQAGSYIIYGFGYAHCLDSYKVVAILFYEYCSGIPTDYRNEVKVHTVGTNSWRRIEDFPTGIPYSAPGKFVSGTLNWLVDAASRSSSVIISLDLGMESYQEVMQPDYGVPLESFTLEVLRDCLCILSHSYTFLEVWLMKEYGNRESWTKLFRIPYMMENFYSILDTRALCLSEDDQVLLEYNSKLVVYDYRSYNFKILKVDSLDGWMASEVYIESLISPS